MQFVAWMKRRERHLSAAAMVAGFVIDNIVFERVDVWQTQALLASYAVACFVSIPLLHFLESRALARGRGFVQVRLLLRFLIQFVLGGFWSAFVIFYGRAAVFGASWPFLLFLLLIFLGSEYFHQYHARLVFTSVLFFFALYAWAIFQVPVVTGTLGGSSFLVSSLVAVGIFALFTIILRRVARAQFYADVWRIRAGAFLVLVCMNLFYFGNVLPPLPLSSTASGVYHQVTHIPGAYQALTEEYAWPVTYLGVAPTLHLVPGAVVYAYSSVYAPGNLSTAITHRWQWFDTLSHTWVTKASVTYPIQGGRVDGYRGYTNMRPDSAGEWRVSIETNDGRVLERISFVVVRSNTTPLLHSITLK